MNRWMECILLIVLLVSLALCPFVNVFALETDVDLDEIVIIDSDEEELEDSDLLASASNLTKPLASASNLAKPQAEEASHIRTATPSNLQFDVVWNETVLEEWIDQHKETGSTVSLGTSVTITQYISVYIHSEITVETGEHSLVYDGGTQPSEIFITGEGLDAPVLNVYRTIGVCFMNIAGIIHSRTQCNGYRQRRQGGHRYAYIS